MLQGINSIIITDIYCFYHTGGSMAPIWPSYYSGVKKVIYVVDAVNLTQLGEATILLMDLLSHPKLKTAQVRHRMLVSLYCIIYSENVWMETNNTLKFSVGTLCFCF